MPLTFVDRTVLIAGASRGIGEAIAGAFAREGAHVIVGGREASRLRATARRLSDASGIEVRPMAGNYADAAEAARILREIEPLDILVICYGDTDAPVGLDGMMDTWDRLMTNNLTGPARLAVAAAGPMRERRTGVILFIGSICGREAIGAPVGYTVSKAGLRGVARTMATELGPYNVRVNLISPGNVLFEGGRWAAKRSQNPEETDAMIRRAVPLGRFGTPDDIAAAAVFLCSDAAAFITGVDLVVDGGQTRSI